MGCCSKLERRWSWIVLSILATLAAVAAVPGAEGQAATDGDDTAVVTNQTCPVLTDEAVDPAQWVEYRGKRVYFCCRMCRAKFQRDPVRYLDHLPQFADSEPTSVQGDDVGQASADGDEGRARDAPHPAAADERTHEPDEAGAADASAGTPAGEDEHAEHDHAAHEHRNGNAGLMRLVRWLGNFHPASVNFPIALLISAALAELLLMVTGRAMFDAAARFCVWLGSASTVGAATLGWFFGGFRLTDPEWVMTVHRWLGTAAGIWAILLLALCVAAHRGEEPPSRWLPWYRFVLFVGATVVAVNGFFGGALVYGLDHYAW